jgi:hypothetical protein
VPSCEVPFKSPGLGAHQVLHMVGTIIVTRMVLVSQPWLRATCPGPCVLGHMVSSFHPTSPESRVVL